MLLTLHEPFVFNFIDIGTTDDRIAESKNFAPWRGLAIPLIGELAFATLLQIGRFANIENGIGRGNKGVASRICRNIF